jgi:hypothetical protein
MAQSNSHAAEHAHLTPIARLGGWMAAERTDIWVVAIYSVAIGLLSLVVPIASPALQC